MEKRYFHIRTFGCQMNVADSRAFSEYFLQMGWSQTENINEANLVLLNTCTVRQHAEDRALSFIGQLKKLKVKSKNLKTIIVAGCGVSQFGEQLKKRFPYVDLVISAKDVEHFPEIMKNCLMNGATTQVKTCDYNHPVSAFVTITRGCNNYCSYCIVPYVRGPEKYRPVEEILDEIKCLVNQGIKEVTLLGQNVNSYKGFRTKGQGVRVETDFADLLSLVNELDGLERIRFLTNHPKDMTEKVIDTIAELPKVCNHIHLPLQSGSDHILELMNRKYTRQQYFSIIDKLRNKVPEISITTDLLVGFPTESENDFAQTLSAVETIKFDFAYVFKYSPREKTKSAELKETVPQEIVEKRHQELLSLCNNISQEKNSKLIGKTVEVLVESKNNKNVFIGKTKDNRTVILNENNNKENLIGFTINAKIIDTKIHSLIGHEI